MSAMLKPTPKTNALASDSLHHGVDHAAHRDQGQTDVHQRPQHHHEGQAWFFQTVAHHGLFFSAQAKFVQHGARILGR